MEKGTRGGRNLWVQGQPGLPACSSRRSWASPIRTANRNPALYAVLVLAELRRGRKTWRSGSDPGGRLAVTAGRGRVSQYDLWGYPQKSDAWADCDGFLGSGSRGTARRACANG